MRSVLNVEIRINQEKGSEAEDLFLIIFFIVEYSKGHPEFKIEFDFLRSE